MSQFQFTSTIKKQGELDIPKAVQKITKWVSPLSKVTLSLKKTGEIVISPYKPSSTVDWKAIWEGIHTVRSFRGKNEIKSAYDLISEDRNQR